MKTVVLMLLLSTCGCAQWTQVQLDLVTQARRGVANVQKRDDERAATVMQLNALRRQRLDEAFDQDVRERESLDADWVIEHRKAYAAALDAYAKQQAAADAALAAEKRELVAIDAALQRLAWLQSIQMKFSFEQLTGVNDGDKH